VRASLNGVTESRERVHHFATTFKQSSR